MRHNTAVTSLCVMAFLAKGYTPGHAPYGDVINRGIDFVLNSSQWNGMLVGDTRSHGPMYSHTISTLMLSEVSGMVDPERQRKIDVALGKALRLILAAQNVQKPRHHEGGWRYQHNSRDSDISCTGWALMSLRSARNNGAAVPKEAIEKAVQFVLNCRNRDGGFGYQPGGGSGVARTGTALLCLELCGMHRSPITIAAGDWVLRNMHRGRNDGFFYYGIYYCAQGMFQLGERHWEKFGEHLYDTLLKLQRDDGSWPEGRGNEAASCRSTSASPVRARPCPSVLVRFSWGPEEAGAMVRSLVTICLAASAAAAPLEDIKVVNDRAPDCSSLEAIVASVTRGCKSDDERAITTTPTLARRAASRPSNSSTSMAGRSVAGNTPSWPPCGKRRATSGATAAGAIQATPYVWMPDPKSPGGRTIAGQLDIKANPALVTEGFVFDKARRVWYHKGNAFERIGGKVNWTAPAFMVCGDTLEGVLSGVRSSRDCGSPRGWGGIRFDDPDYSTAVNLGVGYALTLRWSKIEGAYYFPGRKRGPYHTCGDKDYRNSPAIGPMLEPYNALGRARSYSNGALVFEPDLSNDAFLDSLQAKDNLAWREGALVPVEAGRPARFVVEMASPYVVVRAIAKIDCQDARLEVSRDGKNWAPATPDLTKQVFGAYRYLVRVAFTKPLRNIAIESIVQHNQEALPYLAPGTNNVTVTVANPEALKGKRLVVTYAYCPGFRNRTPGEILDRGAELFRAHYGRSWPGRLSPSR